MKKIIDHDIISSFKEFLGYSLLKDLEAFRNVNVPLYATTPARRFAGKDVYGSPFAQWGYDSSIAGADVPSGVWINNTFTSRSNNLMLDFENGRTLVSGIANTANITGSFAVKDFNIYFTNEGEEDLLVDKKYNSNPRIFSSAQNYVQPYDQVVPAIFLSSESINNQPFAFGGEDTTKISMKAVVMAENAYQLDGALSIFADSQNEVITNIPFTGHPLNEYGDLKNGSYSYEALKTQNQNNSLFFIEEVVTSKLTDKARKSLANDLYVGFIDFEIHQQRYPRS
jgi:hypothetical protein